MKIAPGLHRRDLLRAAAPIALGACGLSACGRILGPKPAISAFDGFIADVGRELLGDSPELSTLMGAATGPETGIDKYADLLDDRSGDSVDVRRGEALRLWAQVRGVERADLSPAQTLTYDALTLKFEAAAAGARFDFGRFSVLDGFSPYVLNPADSAFLTLPTFLDVRHPMPSVFAAEDLIARLGAVGRVVDQETERARKDSDAGIIPPDFVLERTISLLQSFLNLSPEQWPYVTSFQRKVEALLGPVAASPPPARAAATATRPGTALPSGPNETRPESYRARALLERAVTITRDSIAPAYRRALQLLAELRGKAGGGVSVGRLPQGADYYAATLALHTGVKLTPSEIIALGEKRIERLNAELDIALRTQGFAEGSVGARLAAISADPRFLVPDTDEGRAALLAEAQARLAAAIAKLPAWFGAAPTNPTTLSATPASSAAGLDLFHCEPPSPGVAGRLLINLQGAASRPRFDVATLVHHEGAPGRCLQIAIAQAQTKLPLVRRLLGFTAYAEGWACYAEQLADEFGLFDADPIARIGLLRWRLWRAAALVVDPSIHSRGWTREQAAEYLAATTGFSNMAIESEIERCAVMPGRSCAAEIGRDGFTRVRDQARAALGGQFDVRDFHNAVLTNGELPVSVMEEAVALWARSKGATFQRSST